MKPSEDPSDTMMAVSLIARLLLAAALLLWGFGQPPPTKPSASPPVQPSPPVSLPTPPAPAPEAAEPETAGCPLGCEMPKAECYIKGNISYRTGERIYHLADQQYYGKTKMDPASGERWFCTEAEALDNGWRKSKR